ncbi:DNA-3-methyladenine glycosylase [Vreelandella janggokensis]|uniref:DNA-3-methyladenine glycosylase n=1 Tax=Vreelandella janggokensis TaxID=370767 RepID=UPI00285C0063|nr:DNA-3-methyladenine glycosylase [Halomonas janggokensis]MDR5886603.1 DNA-3-methyladenine glycosylase [Halomonas janggokensis]
MSTTHKSTLTPLPQDFYNRDTLTVARDMLGCWLVREDNGEQLAARIVETEAYCGAEDSACHAHRRRSPRTEAMFGPAGHAYVYLVYGMHWLLNVVTEPEDSPCAVLIRAVEPTINEAAMRATRQAPGKQLSNGPGKLTRALSIDKALYGHDMTQTGQLWISRATHSAAIATGPRVGIDYASPEHRDAPWRLWLEGNPWVSKAR